MLLEQTYPSSWFERILRYLEKTCVCEVRENDQVVTDSKTMDVEC